MKIPVVLFWILTHWSVSKSAEIACNDRLPNAKCGKSNYELLFNKGPSNWKKKMIQDSSSQEEYPEIVQSPPRNEISLKTINTTNALTDLDSNREIFVQNQPAIKEVRSDLGLEPDVANGIETMQTYISEYQSTDKPLISNTSLEKLYIERIEVERRLRIEENPVIKQILEEKLNAIDQSVLKELSSNQKSEAKKKNISIQKTQETQLQEEEEEEEERTKQENEGELKREIQKLLKRNERLEEKQRQEELRKQQEVLKREQAAAKEKKELVQKTQNEKDEADYFRLLAMEYANKAKARILEDSRKKGSRTQSRRELLNRNLNDFLNQYDPNKTISIDQESDLKGQKREQAEAKPQKKLVDPNMRDEDSEDLQTLFDEDYDSEAKADLLGDSPKKKAVYGKNELYYRAPSTFRREARKQDLALGKRNIDDVNPYDQSEIASGDDENERWTKIKKVTDEIDRQRKTGELKTNQVFLN